MPAQSAVDLAREALVQVILVASPIVVVAVLAGLLISMLQTLTQVQDQAVGVIPRLLAVLGALIICLPWMLQQMVEYSQTLFEQIPRSIAGG